MLHHITYWNWFAFGAVLFLLEAVTRNGFAFWIGVLAGLFALLLFIFPAIGVKVQLILFFMSAVLVMMAWRRYVKSFSQKKTPRAPIPSNSNKYIGMIIQLEKATINKMGKVLLDDVIWRIKVLKDLPAGAQVKIISVDGVVLIGETINPI